MKFEKPPTNTQEETEKDSRSPEEIKLAEKRMQADRVLNQIRDTYVGDDTRINWDANLSEWIPVVSKALAEERGSSSELAEENEDLIEPMIYLAQKAFDRSKFEPDSEDANIANLAYETFDNLGERYDIRVAMSSGIFKQLEDVGHALQEEAPEMMYSHGADLIKSIESFRSGKEEGATFLILAIDDYLEKISNELVKSAKLIAEVKNITAKPNQEKIDEREREFAVTLPLLKKLSDLRNNLCKKEFGERKSISEIFDLSREKFMRGEN